jgi:hypothetical protein
MRRDGVDCKIDRLAYLDTDILVGDGRTNIKLDTKAAMAKNSISTPYNG